MKICRGCNQDRPLEEFAANQARCRSCRADQRREYKAQNRDRVREGQRVDRQKHPETVQEQKRRHKERHPEKWKARQAAWNAVHRERIAKPNSCERCGTEVEQKREIHAHHHDYSRPLDVEWLCIDCHLAEHEAELVAALPQHQVPTKGQEASDA